MKQKTKLTSVKVSVEAQNKFKYICLENGMNFQKLVNRCLVLYIEDDKFKKQVDKFELYITTK
jgi:hypothetical protein|tara:strand:- start:2990 stop:3178 length:189 start_codon:yes stop_codon:yes gene_type:complete